jgi:hypothetical protein
MDKGTFSVVQYFEDGSSSYVRRSVSLDAAVDAFATAVTASTNRVVVCDERISLIWEFGKGLSRL